MWRCIGAILFVLTYCTGISFITLPFTVSHAGFWPSVIAVAVSWIFLILTGLYYLEAILTMAPGANIPSLSRRYLSKKSHIFNTVAFLAVNYGYLLSFFSFGYPLTLSLLNHLNVPYPQAFAYTFFATLLIGSLTAGVQAATIINAILSVLLGIVYFFTFKDGLQGYKPEALVHFTTAYTFVVIPSLLNSLYFQTMIPTLAHFLKYNLRNLKIVIFSGVTLASLLFISWLWLVITSTGRWSFGEINWLTPGSVTYDKLAQVANIGRWLSYLLVLILVTSALGTGTVMVDFFSDLFRIPIQERRGLKRFLIASLVMAPPSLATLIPGKIVLETMLFITNAGGLFLSGILPIWLIWTLRYTTRVQEKYLVPGGRITLTLVTIISCFFLYLVGLEFLYHALI